EVGDLFKEWLQGNMN
uniref:LOM-SG-SASP=SALIVATION stimulating peptide n=1 Tax=Locusta migratoria TaxID=7004 RepID=Q9TWD5_LOCMI|nr:Lom-SG-SASP=salivation stimulating peptide [Locusta migratoria=locusts, salivary glands, Peptide, 15 aa] [Locusta migratoria]prf//2115412A salivation stimulating peptide [Locusta migratoria]